MFPAARLIAYFEFICHAVGADVSFDPEFPSTADDRFRLRIHNSTQLHALSECAGDSSPTLWQRSTYPAREQSRIRAIHKASTWTPSGRSRARCSASPAGEH